MKKIILLIGLISLPFISYPQELEIDAIYSNNANYTVLGNLIDNNHGNVKKFGSNTWIELKLKDIKLIDSIIIHSPLQYNEIYISFFYGPMYEMSECQILRNKNIETYKVMENSFKTKIVNCSRNASFIKIWSKFNFNLSEVTIYGHNNEIIMRSENPIFEGNDINVNGGLSCFDSEDNDGDGKIDCDDYPCAVGYLDVQYTNPTCPNCTNGKICITAINASKVSIDGGNTWVTMNSSHICFNNLGAGAYYIVAKSPVGCTKNWDDNPVILVGDNVTPLSSCNNGGVEYGVFNNWTGGIGNRGVIPPSDFPSFNNNTIILGDRQSIISTTNFSDPYINTGLIPENGQYLIKLGNDKTGSEMERLTYCFNITQDNKNFNFWYAVVLTDPGHDATEIPFFGWRIIINGNVVYSEKILSNDPFLIDGNSIIRYKGWTCRNLDLTDYIGEEACIEFVTADCSLGGHFGYAYIDGLCSPNQPNNFIMTATDIVCNGMFKVNIEGSGYNQYQYSIKVYKPNGQLVASHTLPLTNGYNASKDDFINYLKENKIVLDCPREIEITLHLYSDCNIDKVLTYTSFYFCPDYEIKPCKDIWVYYPYVITNFTMPGTYYCEDCQYNWQPASYFVDNTVANPEFKSSLYTNITNRTYSLTIDFPDPCTPPITFPIRLHKQDEAYILSINAIDYCSNRVSIRFNLSTSNFEYDDFLQNINIQLDGNIYNFSLN